MRKIFLSFAMMLCLMIGAQAQSSIAYGLKAGLNFATIDGEGVNNTDFRFGYHVGAMLNAPLVLGVSVQPEFLVSLKGSEGLNANPDNLNLLYVDVPVMVKVMLGPVVNLQFGPYVSYMISAQQGDTDVDDAFRNFDGGVGLGLGYTYAKRLTFDARYMYGLSQLSDNINLSNQAGNRVIQLSVGFLMGGDR